MMKYKVSFVLLIFLCSLGVLICSGKLSSSPLDQALAAIHEIASSQEEIKLESLTGGCSGAKIYKATIGKESYVIRVMSADNEDTRKQEINILHLCDKAGLGPRIFAASSEHGWIVMEYLSSGILSLPVKEQALQLAQLLKKLHAANAPYNGVSFYEEVLRDFFSKTIPSSIGNDKEIKDIIKSLNQDILDSSLVWCHRDINYGNVMLSNGNLRLIDFERSWSDSLFFDLADASFAFFHDTPYEKLFLYAYFDRELTIEELHAYKEAKIICFYLRGMQMLPRIKNKAIYETTIVCDSSFKRYREMIYSGNKSLDDDRVHSELAKACFREVVALSKKL